MPPPLVGSKAIVVEQFTPDFAILPDSSPTSKAAFASKAFLSVSASSSHPATSGQCAQAGVVASDDGAVHVDVPPIVGHAVAR